jgi:hypothetical protein
MIAANQPITGFLPNHPSCPEWPEKDMSVPTYTLQTGLQSLFLDRICQGSQKHVLLRQASSKAVYASSFDGIDSDDRLVHFKT